MFAGYIDIGSCGCSSFIFTLYCEYAITYLCFPVRFDNFQFFYCTNNAAVHVLVHVLVTYASFSKIYLPTGGINAPGECIFNFTK